MTILHELISFYNACPVGSIYHVIAARLLQNLNAIGNLSIEELAILCFSSPTAISRIVRKLGCSSYKEFKRDISRALSEYPLRNRCLPYNDMTISSSTETYFKYFHTMLDSLESDINPAYLDQVCNAIHSHARVRLYMAFSTSHAKRQFQLDLVISGKETAFISNPADCFTDIETNDKDSFFIFSCNSYSPAYSDNVKLMRLAHERGAAVLVICPKSTPNALKYANFLIEFDGTNTAMDQYQIDFIINLLTIRYRYMFID